MTTPETTPTILHTDPEHGGLRLAVIVAMFTTAALSFFLLQQWISGRSDDFADYALVLSCLLAMVLGAGSAGALEYGLKRRWHSGRRIVLDANGLEAIAGERSVARVTWSQRVSTVKWQFPMKGLPTGGRERRVPGNTLCLACQLQQDEVLLIAYTFLSPKRAARWTEERAFRAIRPAEHVEASARWRLVTPPNRPTLPKHLFAGKDGPVWLAEQRRPEIGFELTADDWDRFMDYVNNLADEQL